jgi:hypothetical protein
MPYNQAAVVAKPMHPEAVNLATRYIDRFAVSVILQAKVLAHGGSDDVVLRRHIEIAEPVLRRQADDKSWWKQTAVLLGSATFGVGLSNVIREVLSIPPQIPWLIGFVTTMFLGMFVVFWQLRR